MLKNMCMIVTMTTRFERTSGPRFEPSYHLHRAYQVQGKTKWDTHQFNTRDVNKRKGK
jgi:hypothetical protein